MLHRYFVESPVTDERAVLEGPEAHHLLNVMRARAGDAVALFDGCGGEFTAVVVRCTRAAVELRIVERRNTDRESPVSLTLAVALPKGERQKWLVEKLVELGCARLVPLETARGVAQPGESVRARLIRGVIEASKQCRRNRLMAIEAPCDWAALARGAHPSASVDGLRLVAHPGDGSAQPLGNLLGGFGGREVVAAVGPEGGFTDEEIALATATGWRIVDLGPRILRVETAAIALAAIVAAAANVVDDGAKSTSAGRRALGDGEP